MKSPDHFGVREFVSIHGKALTLALLLAFAASAVTAQGEGDALHRRRAAERR